MDGPEQHEARTWARRRPEERVALLGRRERLCLLKWQQQQCQEQLHGCSQERGAGRAAPPPIYTMGSSWADLSVAPGILPGGSGARPLLAPLTSTQHKVWGRTTRWGSAWTSFLGHV